MDAFDKKILHCLQTIVRLYVHNRRVGRKLQHQLVRFSLAELARGANQIGADGKLVAMVIQTQMVI